MKIKLNGDVIESYYNYKKSTMIGYSEKNMKQEVERLIRRDLFQTCAPGFEIDPLTKCKSKAYFEKDIYRKLQQTDQVKLDYLCLDVNDLRSYLDCHGLTAGDMLLKKLINHVQRYYDISRIYRFGGDEYVIDLLDASYIDIPDLEEVCLKKCLLGLEINFNSKDIGKRTFKEMHIIPVILGEVHNSILCSSENIIKRNVKYNF